MSTLEVLNAGPGGIVGLVGSLSRRFRPVNRRSLLVGAAVAGSALATSPKEYALRPVAAYATICGPGNTASSGWTVFCATVNRGVNACPPGSFAAGWWKAAGSSWCGGGYRYIVDCNASCSRCSTGCSDGICDSRCWSCSCGSGSKATCDQRRVCCNAFRYGQCNTQLRCSGGVHCRVVSCVPPYKWAKCTTTSLSDNRTAEHSAPALPRWGPIELKYTAMGAQASYLKSSTGPIHAVGDNKGQYVSYQGGVIYWTSTTAARALNQTFHSVWVASGGPTGIMGYPIADLVTGLRNGGLLQSFQNGAIVDSASTPGVAVTGERYWTWRSNGRENGILGYPIATVAYARDKSFWVQLFEKGAITDSAATTTQVVAGVMWTAWRAAGRELGVLGFPTAARQARSRGAFQPFEKGELWALGTGPARRVFGAVLSEWRNAGGETGSYGYPVSDTTNNDDGRLTCSFEGGTITA